MSTCTGCYAELRLPNRPEFVAVARLAVAAVAARMGFDVEAINDIKVAVAEACTNAIEHGCPKCAHGEQMITVRMELEERELAIVVRDPGDGFDPEQAERQRPQEGPGSQVRGMGMLLIELLMDQVTFSSTPGSGTQVRMTKRLATGGAS